MLKEWKIQEESQKTEVEANTCGVGSFFGLRVGTFFSKPLISETMYIPSSWSFLTLLQTPAFISRSSSNSELSRFYCVYTGTQRYPRGPPPPHRQYHNYSYNVLVSCQRKKRKVHLHSLDTTYFW